MASDRKQFERAMRNWEDLAVRGAFSLEHALGQCAYIYSTNGTISSPKKEEAAMQAERYESEAYRLSRLYRIQGKKTLCLAGITMENMERVLTDERISDVYIIGDGSFSYVFSDEDEGNKTDDEYAIDWQDVSTMASHLKSGVFVQRTCGKFDYHLGVPFGTFAMRDHSQIFAPLNEYFSPESFTKEADIREEESKITRVSTHRKLTYSDIRQLFPKDRGHL